MHKPTYLSPAETRVLHFINRGKTNPEIATLLGMTLANVHTTTSHIRKKLGTKPGAPLRKVHHVTPPNQPTPVQRQYMEALASGMDYQQIALRHGVTAQNVKNMVGAGCERAGITGQGHNRTAAIKAYLAQPKATAGAISMEDPAFN